MKSGTHKRPLIDRVCQFEVTDGVICGAHFQGNSQSLWCPEHKAAGKKRSDARSRQKSVAVKSGGDYYIKVQSCPVCRKPFLPTAAAPEVCHCADQVTPATVLHIPVVHMYYPAVDMAVDVLVVEKHIKKSS